MMQSVVLDGNLLDKVDGNLLDKVVFDGNWLDVFINDVNMMYLQVAQK